MVTDIETVDKAVNSYIADVKHAMPIDKVFLFGSYAKGTAREDSDIDLCFFSSSFDRPPAEKVLLKLFALKRNYNIFIEPHAFPTSELTNDNPFVKEILRTGREM
jgi:predicted nucleotidyltransferase